MQLALLQVFCIESTRLNAFRRSLAYYWSVGGFNVDDDGKVMVTEPQPDVRVIRFTVL